MHFNTDITLTDATRIMWLRNNRGVLARVARELAVTPGFVSLVFDGKKRSSRVERALRASGADVAKKAGRSTSKRA